MQKFKENETLIQTFSKTSNIWKKLIAPTFFLKFPQQLRLKGVDKTSESYVINKIINFSLIKIYPEPLGVINNSRG